MAKIVFENFKRQVQGASFQTHHRMIKGAPGSGFFGFSTIDPNRIPNTLSPFPTSVGLINASTIDTTVTKMVNYINDAGKIYAIGAGKLYEIDSGGNEVNLTSPYPHTIDHSHTGETLSDIIIYENSGTFEIFYSFNDATDGDIGRLSSVQSSDSFDDDYYSNVVGGTVLNKNVPHPMAIGDNNICYIGNGSVLASMDLRTGSPAFTDIEIDILGGWVIKDHISFKGFHWIAAREIHSGTSADVRQPGRCAIFVWDYIKNNFDEIYYIDDTDIFNIFIHEGELHVSTIQARSNSKIRIFNGITFVPRILYTPRSTITLGGINERHGMLMWGSSTSGEVYTLGNPNEQKTNDFNIIGDIGGGCTAIIQRPFFEDSYYFATSTPGLTNYRFDISGGFSASASTWVSLRHDFNERVVIQEFRVYFPDLTFMAGTGDANEKFQLDAYFNGNSSNVIMGLIGSDETSKGYKVLKYNKTDVYCINIGFRWNSNIGLTDPTILPYRIEVIYESTGKR